MLTSFFGRDRSRVRDEPIVSTNHGGNIEFSKSAVPGSPVKSSKLGVLTGKSSASAAAGTTAGSVDALRQSATGSAMLGRQSQTLESKRNIDDGFSGQIGPSNSIHGFADGGAGASGGNAGGGNGLGSSNASSTGASGGGGILTNGILRSKSANKRKKDHLKVDTGNVASSAGLAFQGPGGGGAVTGNNFASGIPGGMHQPDHQQFMQTGNMPGHNFGSGGGDAAGGPPLGGG
ncbi:unnamed protein product, partial [Amoebophrya sp. A25]|eukprot:GSA25T00000889001.1